MTGATHEEVRRGDQFDLSLGSDALGCIADGVAVRNAVVPETTAFTMSYDYEPKGALAFILGPLLERQFNKGFNAFIDNLETAAQARAATPRRPPARG